ncbi:unnamed protein product [Pipistrellus nathusii]|uniref:Uncharacterized protein n=1 Tax=Pipistrellus nathusii TaxID=59473 RepID=A0ABP0A5D4_PIPNA
MSVFLHIVLVLFLTSMALVHMPSLDLSRWKDMLSSKSQEGRRRPVQGERQPEGLIPRPAAHGVSLPGVWSKPTTPKETFSSERRRCSKHLLFRDSISAVVRASWKNTRGYIKLEFQRITNNI